MPNLIPRHPCAVALSSSIVCIIQPSFNPCRICRATDLPMGAGGKELSLESSPMAQR